MENTTNNNQSVRDEKLWKAAKKRVEFKKHLLVYLLINVFLWAIWFFTEPKHSNSFLPWPAYVSLGWGIGLMFNFIGVYTGFKDNMVENEYNKLVNKE